MTDRKERRGLSRSVALILSPAAVVSYVDSMEQARLVGSGGTVGSGRRADLAIFKSDPPSEFTTLARSGWVIRSGGLGYVESMMR